MNVIGLNFNKREAGLELSFRETLQKLDCQYKSVHAANIVISLVAGTASVFDKGLLLSFDNTKIFFRGRGKQQHMTSLLIRLFKHQNIPIYGSMAGAEFTHNDGKITQMVDLTLAKLPIPNTLIFSKDSLDDLAEIALTSKFEFPLVLKKTGSKGAHVWKVNTIEEVRSLVLEAEIGELYILQEYIPNTFDIRALYFHGNFLGAIARHSKDGFYNNVSLGAFADTIELTEEENILAKQACVVLQQNFAGVDIVRSARGPLFFEVNNRPGYQGFEAATGISVGEQIARLLVE
ncbi:MAG: hypothetical protein RLZZ70_839 [Candidatus Parcubacteria bacterium]|jgi:RimK family alpha-L-glutamate ligase